MSCNPQPQPESGCGESTLLAGGRETNESFAHRREVAVKVHIPSPEGETT